MAKEDVAPRSVGGGRCMTPRAGLRVTWTPPNKRMHATRDTSVVIELYGAGGRVMRGVRFLLRNGILPIDRRAAAGSEARGMETAPAVVNGMTLGLAGGGRHGVGCASSFPSRVTSGALKVAGI